MLATLLEKVKAFIRQCGYYIGYPIGVLTSAVVRLLASVPVAGQLFDGMSDGFAIGAIDWNTAYLTAVARLEQAQADMMASLRIS